MKWIKNNIMLLFMLFTMAVMIGSFTFVHIAKDKKEIEVVTLSGGESALDKFRVKMELEGGRIWSYGDAEYRKTAALEKKRETIQSCFIPYTNHTEGIYEKEDEKVYHLPVEKKDTAILVYQVLDNQIKMYVDKGSITLKLLDENSQIIDEKMVSYNWKLGDIEEDTIYVSGYYIEEEKVTLNLILHKENKERKEGEEIKYDVLSMLIGDKIEAADFITCNFGKIKKTLPFCNFLNAEFIRKGNKLLCHARYSEGQLVSIKEEYEEKFGSSVEKYNECNIITIYDCSAQGKIMYQGRVYGASREGANIPQLDYEYGWFPSSCSVVVSVE